MRKLAVAVGTCARSRRSPLAGPVAAPEGWIPVVCVSPNINVWTLGKGVVGKNAM